ncbi:MAG: hypothetical protein J6Z47_06665 [Bacteroidales bacterium]|nr:hypothetical protein [Bacteroidales bacterium]
MTSVTRHLLRVCLAAFCSVGLASCVVDNSYDFSEDNVDWTVNVLKGADLPLGSSQRISVGDLISSFAKGILDVSDDGYIVNVPAGITVTGQKFGFVPVHGISKMDTDKIRINSAEYHLDLKNDLPVALGITAEAVDADDNRVEGVLVECSGSVAAGTEQNPSTTSLTMKVTPAGGVINFDGFRIILTIEQFPENGTPIGSSRGVTILNSYLSFPEGITHID